MRALLLLLMSVMSLWADWSEDPGSPLHLGNGIDPQIMATSDGGAYVAWLSDGSFHIYLQRLDALGNPLWATGGLLVSNAPNSSWIAVYHLNLVVDGDDNAILSAVDTRTGNWEVYLYKLDSEGNQLWGENGLQLSSSGGDNISPRLALVSVDNSVVVTWSDNFTSLRLQRINPAGQLLWGENGISISTFNANFVSPQPKIDSDGTILVQAIRQTGSFPALSSQVILQKYSIEGVAQWSAWSQLATAAGFPLGNWLQDVSPDNLAGAYSSWTELTQQNQTGKIQRIYSNGDLAWDSPLELSTETTRFRISPRIATPANSSNVYAVWSESDANQINRGLMMQSLDSMGTPLWGTSGLALESLGPNVFFDMQVDAWGGDLFTCYIRQLNNGAKDVVAARMLQDGSYAWDNERVTVTNSGSDKGDLAIARGFGCTFIVWEDSGNIQAHCLREDGSLGVVTQPEGVMIRVPEDYTTIQSAIDASESGDTILVAPGMYFEPINYSGKNITLGSLTLTTGDLSYVPTTIIDGSRIATVVTFNSGESNAAALVGFTIQNGTAGLSDPDGDGDSSSYGGGLLCVNASPELRHLIIQNNSAQGGGGGGLFCYNASPTLMDIKFNDNASGDVGGAIYAKLNCNLEITNASFIGNTCPSVGAAIYARDSSTLKLDHVLIARNYSDHAGGGIGLKANTEAILSNVTMTDNFALHHGGSLYSNSSKYIVINTILWNNAGGEVYFADFDDPSEIILSYSTLQDSSAGITTNDNGTVIWQGSNLDLNPLFEDTLAGDYSLNFHSPCVDGGTVLFIWDEDTLFQTNSYQGLAPDMGVYELTPEIVDYFPLMVNSGWVLASDIDTMEIVMTDSTMIEGNRYYIFNPEYPYYPFESINPFRVDGNQVKVWTGDSDELLYDIAVPLNTTWEFMNEGVWEYSQITLSSYGETIETEMGTYENCYGFHRFIGADYEYYDWLAPGAGLVQRDVITFAGPRRYSLIDFLIPVGMEDEREQSLPQKLRLMQNYPNPFNPATTINYELAETSLLSIAIYDLSGTEVNVLQNGIQEVGAYSTSWSGRDRNGQALAAGVYFCRVKSSNSQQTIKMVLLK